MSPTAGSIYVGDIFTGFIAAREGYFGRINSVSLAREAAQASDVCDGFSFCLSFDVMANDKKVIQVKGGGLELLPERPPFDRAKLAKLGVRGLHCGSGTNLHPHWLNTDIIRLVDEGGRATNPAAIARIAKDRFYLEHDHTRPLPVADSALDFAFAEHFIEHITVSEAVDWMREMRRMLRVGGILRVSTPDMRKYVAGYLNPQNGFYESHRKQLLAMGVKNVPGRPAWMLNQIFSFWGHKWLYDPDEVRTVATAAGFSPKDVVEVSYRKSQAAALSTLDLEVRSDESMYLEITRR